MKIIIEYDDSKLKKLSDILYNLFLSKYDVLLLDNNLSQEEKNNVINNNNNFFLLSNKINNINNIEIIYPLNSTDILAKELNDSLSKITTVSKYYQLRYPNITNLDYYEIFRNIKNNKAIIIKYGSNDLNNETIPKTIYQTISNYLNEENIYIVKSGDSLYSIARKYSTTVDELKKINNLTSNILSINQKLIIPFMEEETNNTYIVKSGDSLYSIAKRYNTTVDELKRINNLTSNLLSINQKLIIPSNESNIYTVVKGDSLYSISKRFNTTVNKIKNDNNLTSDLLSIGQKLIIKK